MTEYRRRDCHLSSWSGNLLDRSESPARNRRNLLPSPRGHLASPPCPHVIDRNPLRARVQPGIRSQRSGAMCSPARPQRRRPTRRCGGSPHSVRHRRRRRSTGDDTAGARPAARAGGERQLERRREALLAGDIVNASEKRPGCMRCCATSRTACRRAPRWHATVC